MFSRRRFLQTGAAAMVAGAGVGRGGQAHTDGEVFKVLLGDYPHTAALKERRAESAQLQLQFVNADPVFSAFKRVVRDFEFDFAELSLVTFLQAKAYGKPLILLPAVMFSRFQHPYLIGDTERQILAPKQLEGRRVGVRLYTSTTGTWLRGILTHDYHVDCSAIQWKVFDDPHLIEFQDPPSVQKSATGQLGELLLRGEIDAAIVDPVPNDARFRPVISDPDAAARRWAAHNRAIQINHMVVARADLAQRQPRAIQTFYDVLLQSKKMASLGDSIPFGWKANRRNLAVAIGYVYEQGLIPRRFDVDELIDEATINMQ